MFRIFLAIKCRITCCVPAFYSVYAVIAGVNLKNLKANHNSSTLLVSIRYCMTSPTLRAM